MCGVEQEPQWMYKVDGIPANLWNGQFNTVGGHFIEYVHLTFCNRIEIMCAGCPKCNAHPQWYKLSDLIDAEMAIQCEYCDFMTAPITYTQYLDLPRPFPAPQVTA